MLLLYFSFINLTIYSVLCLALKTGKNALGSKTAFLGTFKQLSRLFVLTTRTFSDGPGSCNIICFQDGDDQIEKKTSFQSVLIEAIH